MENDNDQRARDLRNLGWLHLERFWDTEALSDLEQAIKHLSRAVAETANEHPKLAERLTDLGIAYTGRYETLGELEDLKESIRHISRALALTPEDHPDISRQHASLGVSYGHRYQRLGELADLEKIECFTHALALTPDGHPDLSDRHANLGASYDHRYQRLGKLADLEKAIECHTRAFALTPDGHLDMPDRHAILGISYCTRYQRLGEPADIEKAIECNAHALVSTPEGHPDMSDRHANLGVSYRDRYQRLGELTDLEKAIECDTRALALTPDRHPVISRRHASLGVSYTDRYQRLGELADLERAIECDTRALALTPESHPVFPTRHFNYALSLLNQYHQSGHLACLTDSLHSFRKASQHLTGAPRDKFDHALQWANLASKQNHLNPIEAYQTAIDLLPQFIWFGATAKQRYEDLLLTENLAVNACFAAIQSSNYSLALEWLEHARCVVWNQSLMLRSPLDQLHSVYPDLSTQLQSVANQLDNSSFETEPTDSITTEQAGQQRRRLAIEYHSLLAQTRQLLGFENFLKPVQADTLMHAVRDGPIVVVNCHTDRCDALFILPGNDQVGHLALPNFTEEKAKQARSDLELSLRRQQLRERGVRVLGISGYEDRMESMLSDLWSNLFFFFLSHLILRRSGAKPYGAT